MSSSVLQCTAVRDSATQCVKLSRAHYALLMKKAAMAGRVDLQCVVDCDAVCCSLLQSVAVCCSVLQCVAVCCSVLQCVAVC